MQQLSSDLTPSLSPEAQVVVDYLVGSRPKGCDIYAMFRSVEGVREHSTKEKQAFEVDFKLFDGNRATCRVEFSGRVYRSIREEEYGLPRPPVRYGVVWTKESWPKMEGGAFGWDCQRCRWERVQDITEAA